jgi:hypothetical protein
MSWWPWRGRDTEPVAGPSRREVSAALMRPVHRVFAAQRMCSVATGVDLAVARRELAGIPRESMTRVSDPHATAKPRVQLRARKDAAAMVEMSRPWLILDFPVLDRSWCVDPKFTSAEAGALAEAGRTSGGMSP